MTTEEALKAIRSAQSREEMANAVVLLLLGVTLAELEEEMQADMIEVIDAIKETYAE